MKERTEGTDIGKRTAPHLARGPLSEIVLSRAELDKTKRAIAIKSLLGCCSGALRRTEYADPKPITDIPKYDRGPG